MQKKKRATVGRLLGDCSATARRLLGCLARRQLGDCPATAGLFSLKGDCSATVRRLACQELRGWRWTCLHQILHFRDGRERDGREKLANESCGRRQGSLETQRKFESKSDASELSPTGLFEYIAFLEQQGLDTKAYELAFWQKCLHPLAIMSLVLVALSFIFGPLRSSTMGYRIFIGVVVGISFQFTQNLLGPSSLIYGFSPFYAVLSPIIIISALGLILLYRVR